MAMDAQHINFENTFSSSSSSSPNYSFNNSGSSQYVGTNYYPSLNNGLGSKQAVMELSPGPLTTSMSSLLQTGYQNNVLVGSPLQFYEMFSQPSLGKFGQSINIDFSQLPPGSPTSVFSEECSPQQNSPSYSGVPSYSSSPSYSAPSPVPSASTVTFDDSLNVESSMGYGTNSNDFNLFELQLPVQDSLAPSNLNFMTDLQNENLVNQILQHQQQQLIIGVVDTIHQQPEQQNNSSLLADQSYQSSSSSSSSSLSPSPPASPTQQQKQKNITQTKVAIKRNVPKTTLKKSQQNIKTLSSGDEETKMKLEFIVKANVAVENGNMNPFQIRVTGQHLRQNGTYVGYQDIVIGAVCSESSSRVYNLENQFGNVGEDGVCTIRGIKVTKALRSRSRATQGSTSQQKFTLHFSGYDKANGGIMIPIPGCLIVSDNITYLANTKNMLPPNIENVVKATSTQLATTEQDSVYSVTADRIKWGKTNHFTIGVFDENGNLLYEVNESNHNRLVSGQKKKISAFVSIPNNIINSVQSPRIIAGFHSVKNNTTSWSSQYFVLDN